MAWYWIALILGLITPWIVSPGKLRVAFQEGMTTGLGAWFGLSLITIPGIFLIMWLLRLLI